MQGRTLTAYRPRRRSFARLFRAVAAHRRVATNDWMLATLLAAVAGALNAGGFFVVGQYTSHMTGYLSQIADNLVVQNFEIAGIGFLVIMSFIGGAALCAFLVNLARYRNRQQSYALPIAVQGASLMVFAVLGAWGVGRGGHIILLLVLAALMGMQNATITKISRARIRTTHVTGMVTDMGIEIGRWIYGRTHAAKGTAFEARKFILLVRLVLSFMAGGIVGALAFAHFGFWAAMPIGLMLLALAGPTILTRN